jgi:Bifunctional DNA primase/polymerase, N-terminal
LWATPDALVLDVDVHEGGDDGYQAYRALADENGGDGGAVAVQTRSGGLHLWYRNPDDSIGRRPGVRPGLDLLGRDGYKILWQPGKLPALTDLPDPPPWVVNLAERMNENGAAPSVEYDDGALISYGQRHAVFVSFAGRLRRLGLGADAIEAAMLDALLPRCQPERKDTRAHIRDVAVSVAGYDPRRPVRRPPPGGPEPQRPGAARR